MTQVTLLPTSDSTPPPHSAPSHPGLSTTAHLLEQEPETLEEAREATKRLKAAQRARGEFADHTKRKEQLLAEMIDLMTKLIATPHNSPQRPAIRDAYMRSKEQYYAHKNRSI